jgi:CheY-like chemotaxis protein
MVAKLLRARRYEVETAATGRDALILCAAGRSFDLLIADIGLPDCDGRDLLGRMKKLFSVKSIALSGYATVADVEKSRSAGFDLHLCKPVDLTRLLAAIDKVCRPIPAAAKE